MATKHDDPCRDRAGDTEPIFTLRAQDELAPEVVALWATLAARAGTPHEKVRGAVEVSMAMHRWQRKHLDRVKVPD